MQLKKDINSNLITIKNLINLNEEINSAISLIYKTIKNVIKSIYVVTEVQPEKHNILQLSFWLD